MGLIEEIGPGPIALDTAIFVYFIEENPRYLPLLEPLFGAIDAGRLAAVTSTLTLLETLVVPLRRGRTDLARRYEELLVHGRGLALVPLDLDLLRAAAALRAHHGLRTPDALQLAAAFAVGATAFLTHDRRLPPDAGLRILQLDDRLR